MTWSKSSVTYINTNGDVRSVKDELRQKLRCTMISLNLDEATNNDIDKILKVLKKYVLEALKRMRAKDDRIVYELNRIVPTQSFAKKVDTTNQCKSLYEQVNYGERDNAIKRCINMVSIEVSELRDKKVKDPDNDATHKKLKDKQRQLRLMQKELQVDEVVKDRSLKVFYEKCRNAYLPPNRPDL